MPTNRSPMLLIAVVVLGILALGGGALMFMGGGSQQPQQVAATPTATPFSKVYVATRDIPPRTEIDNTMIRSTTINGTMPEGALVSSEDFNKDTLPLKGQLTSKEIPMGAPVTLTSFRPEVTRVVPANIPVPKGMRALAIYVDSIQTAAGLVDVGDRIDVIATHRMSWDKQPNQYTVGATNFTTGQTVATDLQVLAVDQSLNAPPPTPTPAPGAAPGPPAAPTPAPAPNAPGAGSARIRVILAAPPIIAANLIAAEDQGTLHIVIRNPDDHDNTVPPEVLQHPSRLIFVAPKKPAAPGGESKPVREPGPVWPTNMMQSTPAPVATVIPIPLSTPVPPAPPTTEITVVRGTEKTRVIVPQR